MATSKKRPTAAAKARAAARARTQRATAAGMRRDLRTLGVGRKGMGSGGG